MAYEPNYSLLKAHVICESCVNKYHVRITLQKGTQIRYVNYSSPRPMVKEVERDTNGVTFQLIYDPVIFMLLAAANPNVLRMDVFLLPMDSNEAWGLHQRYALENPYG